MWVVNQQYDSGGGLPHASYRALSLSSFRLIDLVSAKRRCWPASSSSVPSSSYLAKYVLPRRFPSQVSQCCAFFWVTFPRAVEILHRVGQKPQR